VIDVNRYRIQCDAIGPAYQESVKFFANMLVRLCAFLQAHSSKLMSARASIGILGRDIFEILGRELSAMLKE